MNDLLELAPRPVADALPETEVDFAQTLDSTAQDQGRCPVTIPRITWGAGCT
jgi:hypothetical protein